MKREKSKSLLLEQKKEKEEADETRFGKTEASEARSSKKDLEIAEQEIISVMSAAVSSEKSAKVIRKRVTIASENSEKATPVI